MVYGIFTEKNLLLEIGRQMSVDIIASSSIIKILQILISL